MSAAVRTEIAAVVAAVPGVLSCSPYYQQTMRPAAAAINRRGTSHDTYGGIVTWRVIIPLASDQGAAERYMDTIVQDVVAALRTSRVITVRSSEQQQMQLPDNTIYPVAVIEGTREQE